MDQMLLIPGEPQSPLFFVTQHFSSSEIKVILVNSMYFQMITSKLFVISGLETHCWAQLNLLQRSSPKQLTEINQNQKQPQLEVTCWTFCPPFLIRQQKKQQNLQILYRNLLLGQYLLVLKVWWICWGTYQVTLKFDRRQISTFLSTTALLKHPLGKIIGYN